MSSDTVIHIAATNLADLGLCGAALQTNDKVLAPYMKLDQYLRHWGPAAVIPYNVPSFCPTCRTTANARASAPE
jgi:hypothetical protein